MNKYLNRGLLYQWFNSAKYPIMIGLIVWGFIANDILNLNLGQVEHDLAHLDSDYFMSASLEKYLVLGLIFMLIQFIAVGINKRNTIMFLSSGPYTKKQIKYNELIALLINLALFVIVFVYIAITFYIRNKNVLSIITGYTNIISIEVTKIILFGIIGIIYMLIMDILFSNSVIGFMTMIFVIPPSILLIIEKLESILRYWGVGNNKNIIDKIHYLIRGTEKYAYNPNILMDRISINLISLKQLSIEIIATLTIIIIMIIIFNLAQNKYNLASGNKVFSSKLNENIVVTLASIGIGIFANFLIFDSFRSDLVMKTGEFVPVVGMELIELLAIDVFSIVIVGFIVYKIIKKILKTVG